MTTIGDGKSGADDSVKMRRELLLKVYGSALDECRFNVLLSWDRTKFFLLLNSGFVAAGIGLLKAAEGSVLASIFLVLFFLLSILVSVFGLETARVGKAYYREAVYTKTLVERELGLLDPLPGLDPAHGNLSIAVTRGQRNFELILSGKARPADFTETPIASGTVARYTHLVFIVMIVIEALAALASLISALLQAKL